MLLLGFVCTSCRDQAEAFDDEPIPVCCDTEMKRKLSTGGASGSVFQLFRPYNNGQTMISSKAEEKRMLAGMARTHVGESAENLRIEPINEYKRKVEIEELRHKVVKDYAARSPQIAKRFADRPVKELKTL